MTLHVEQKKIVVSKKQAVESVSELPFSSVT